MAINLNDNISVLAAKPTDARYLNNLTPYTSPAQVNTLIVSSNRYEGLTVNVNGVEYWYATGISDGDLVIKDSGIASTGITKASNGLTKVGTAVILGGTLTGVTTLTAQGGTALLQYGGDYSANYGPRTFVDASYVTGKTNSISTGLTANYYNKSQINSYTGKTNSRISTIESKYVTGSTNGLTKFNTHDICLGGALSSNVIIGSGSNLFGVNAGNINLTGTSVSVGGAVKLTSTPATGANTDGFLVWNSGDKCVKQVNVGTIIGASITGATNGLTKNGQVVSLGGALTGNTVFNNTSSQSLRYSTNSSSGYTARSIPDAGYVTGKTSAVATFACNGLTKNGQYIGLGGALCGADTCISMASFATGNDVARCLMFYSTDGATGGPASFFIAIDSCGSSAPPSCVCSSYRQDINSLRLGYQGGWKNGGPPSYICLDNTGINFNQVTGNVGITTQFPSAGSAGMKYAANYDAYFTNPLQIPDVGFVTGKTNSISTGLTANYYNKSQINSYTGKTNSRISTIESKYVTGSTNGITKFGSHDLCLGGALIQNTCISGAYKFGLFTNQVNITGATSGVSFGGCVFLKTAPAGSGGLLCINNTTGQICQTSLSAFGGLTGATNGLSDCGNQRIGLGGNLCADTTIGSAGSHSLTIGKLCGICLATSGETLFILDAQNSGNLFLKSESGTSAISNSTAGAIGISMDYAGTSGFNIFDNRPGTGATGIVYAADYSLNYVPRSLVDKGYVDSVATGLNVHAAVIAATTVPITLSGLSIIDGIQTVDGMRILVKNQPPNNISGSTANGIYNAHATAWTRSSDYDDVPPGEITNGDLIPVTSGSTQNSSIWVLTTPDPITLNVTPLAFSEFSTVIDVQGGPGIAITQVGGIHTVCVELGNGASSGCGLAVSNSGLCVASSIAGTGLTYTLGILRVNAANGGSAASIPVKFYNNNLVLNCSDVIASVNAVTGATNGLTETNNVVKLGGNLCENTTITMPTVGTTSLTFTDDRVGSSAVGVQYGGNYGANYTARSLTDADYVTGLTKCANAIAPYALTGASNGLTKSGNHDVNLGGTLCCNTLIEMTSGYTFAIQGYTYNPFICMADYKSVLGDNCHHVELFSNCNTSVCSNKCVQIQASDIKIYANNTGIFGLTFCKGVVTDNWVVPSGLTYASSAYRDTFVDTSLVDKGYVNNMITGGTGIINASNGLTKSGNVVVLGGTLTGKTTIDAGIYNFNVTGNSNIISFKAGNVNICAGNGYGNGVSFKTHTGSGGITTALVNCVGVLDLAQCNATCYAELLISAVMGSSFTDTTTNSAGLVYGADYSGGYTARSLVDAAYVTGRTSQAITTANNGLTKDNQNISLGGYLTGNTAIQTNEFNFSVHNAASTCLSVSGETIRLYGGAGIKINDNTCVSIGTSGGNKITFDNNTGCNFLCSSASIPFAYGQELTNFSDCAQIPNLAYVTGKTNTLVSSTNKEVIFNSSGSLVGNANFTYNCTGDSLQVGTSSVATGFASVAMAAGIACGVFSIAMSNGCALANNSMAFLDGCACGTYSFASGVQNTAFSGYSAVIGGNQNCNYGSSSVIIGGTQNLLNSGNDCSVVVGGTNMNIPANTYCSFAIVPSLAIFNTPSGSGNFLYRNPSNGIVETVNAITGLTGALVTACNGLSYSNGNVSWGGTLTGTTKIVTAGSILEICNTGGLDFSFGSADATISNNNNRLYIDNTCAALCGNACTVVNSLNGSVNITAASASYVNITAPSGVTLQSTPPAGLTSDKVLVWNSGDKKIKTVNGASLGDKNNIYAMTVVTTSTALGTGDTYVQIVNSPSVSVTLTLPATPINGQVFRIKDAGNNAVNYPITVAASGGKVIDNGAGTASLNTDGGALELVYNASLGSWFVFSFVN